MAKEKILIGKIGHLGNVILLFKDLYMSYVQSAQIHLPIGCSVSSH